MSSSELFHHLLQENNNLRRSSSSSSRRHNPKTGLVTPNASFSSLASSVSNPSPPHAPRTPLRSAHLPTSPATPKARPSPLFRLLHPPSSPLPSPSMTLHHPTPLYSQQPPSPTNPSVSNSTDRPSSRSERLLRDTLHRDEMERSGVNDPLLPSPLVSTNPVISPSVSPNAHRRRHSHVPISSIGTVAHEEHLREREEYTRGSFLFRTAMTNARPPSPSFSFVSHQHHDSIAYGGDAEYSVPSTPLKNEHRHQNVITPGRPSMSSRRGMSPVSNARSRSDYSPARNASPSPSPMRRKQGPQHRPSPLPLESGAVVPPDSDLYRINEHPSVRRKVHHHDPQQESPSKRPRNRHDPFVSPSQGEPLLMTPHEQVLRARLEKVLKSGRVLQKKECGREAPGREGRGRSESGSRSNEVRDEEGGRPWRRPGQDRDSALPSGDSVVSAALQSSDSNSSFQSFLECPRSSGSRTRSKTDPTPPKVLSRADAPSPKRSTTAPSAVNSPYKKLIKRTGTTPPLVPDASPVFGPMITGEDEGEDLDGELNLLTPPPTPPFTGRAQYGYDYTRGAIAADGYFPSPYKTNQSENVYTTTRRSIYPIGQDAPRRPANPPVWRPPSPERRHSKPDDQDDSSSNSSYQPSSISSTFAQGNPDLAISQSPPAVLTLSHHPSQPQFNARKASVQCRAMAGYVSFASVEGLGMPPDDLTRDMDDGVGKEERGRSGGPAGVFAWGVGGFRKLLGGVVGAGENERLHNESVVL